MLQSTKKVKALHTARGRGPSRPTARCGRRASPASPAKSSRACGLPTHRRPSPAHGHAQSPRLGRAAHLVMTLACVRLSILLASNRACPHKPFFIADSKASCKGSESECEPREQQGPWSTRCQEGAEGATAGEKPNGPKAPRHVPHAEMQRRWVPSLPLVRAPGDAVAALCRRHRQPRGRLLPGPGPAGQQRCHPLHGDHGLQDADSPGPERPWGPPGICRHQQGLWHHGPSHPSNLGPQFRKLLTKRQKCFNRDKC